MKVLRASLFLSLLTASCLSQELEDKLYENFKTSIQSDGTYSYYCVIKVRDLNSGKEREICTAGNFVLGAIHREYDIDYSDKGSHKSLKIAMDTYNNNNYFEFKKDSALKNLGLNQYTDNEFMRFQNQVNFDSIAKKLNGIKSYQWRFNNDKQIRMFAHALFKRGILTMEFWSLGGTLYYVEDPNKIPRW